ncbi:Bap-like [Trichomonas vaginalis G3]|uniref:Bap-like n=1 Tax=Trichomonas vaginalis (strain ATCC PRA-98 / G3) TaxID=412133 RepID=A2DLM4_TRIV3|nr:hypothetical protein TVAGG3_0580500 [Trichomonas vaginalis G3]EAY18657.1 Bap-like [Trichomonas vaginalis G3]KAI5522542.1 hypothetical protein TVAGG3_0580500 [Trichomonas vaginalis G3]|eukprot:XP_001579643.1 Bap-like [Trichomonas vaginalis G3]
MLCFLLAAALSIIEINFESPIIPFGDLFDMTGNQFEIKNVDDFTGNYTVVYTINQSSKTYEYQLNLDSEPYFRAAGLDMDEDYENYFPRGSVSFDVKFIKNGVVEGIGNFTAFIALPIEVHKAVMEPKIIEYSPKTVLPIVINLTNYNPDHNSQIFLQSPRRRIGWPNNKSINYYFEHQKESTQGTTKLHSIKPSGHNYTLNLYVIDGTVQNSKTEFNIDYAVRKKMDINFVKHDKEFYYPNDESNLTFVFPILEEIDTWYTVYVNEKKSVLITNNKPFHISYQIPSTAELGDFQITYSVTVEDILKSENHSLTLKIRDKPVLTNIVNKETYLISETINILFDCIDHDSTDSFQIQYLMEDDAGYKNYGERVPREGDTTKMSFLVDKNKLKRGRNIFNLSVVDNYSIESDPISLLIMIVEPPTIIVSNNESFFIPGSKISPHIIITDLDEDENESISYYFDNDENSKKHLQSILIDSSTHVYNGDLQQIEIPSTARSGTINLTIVVTDRYNFTTNATLVLTIREPPVLTGENISEIKTPSSNATFTIKVEDHDENDYCDLFYHYDGIEEPVNVSRTSINQSTHQASVPVEIPLPEEYSGVFSITFYAIDSHNITSQNITLTVEIRNKPEISNIKHKEQYLMTDVFNITFDCKDKDPTDSFQMKYAIDDQNYNNYSGRVNRASEVTPLYIIIEKDKLHLGVNNISIIVEDDYEMTSNYLNITIHIVDPLVITGENISEIKTPSSNAIFTIKVEDNDENDYCDLFYHYDGIEEPVNVSRTSINQSTHQASVPVEIPLPEEYSGVFSITFYAIDSHNITSQNITLTVEIRNKPEIQIEKGIPQIVQRNEKYTISVKVTDNDAEEEFSFFINGKNYTKKFYSNSKETDADLDIQIPNNLLGETNIILKAVDKYGLQSEPVQLNFSIRSKPEIKINEGQRKRFIPGSTINLSVFIKDDDPGDNSTFIVKFLDKEFHFNDAFQTNESGANHNLSITIPSDVKGGNESIIVTAKDYFNLSSSDTTSIYIPTAPVIQYEGTDSNTTIPGNFARPKFLVSDKDGDKNITIIINLPDGTNISKQADCSRINEPELKCNNNPYEIDIKIPEDHPITKPYIINVTVIDSDGQGQNITAEIPFRNRAPQIEYTNKSELEKDNEYYQTRNITIKFRVKDSNFGDWANIYMKIYPDEKKLFNKVNIINKTKTGQNWTYFEFNLTIPSDYKDDDYNITLWATDKFGAESNSTYVMIKIRGSYAALAGNVDLRILVERRWIILVVVACIIAVILFIIFIIILLIRPEPKIKQVVKEPSEEIDRDDSGETISVHSDDMDDENPPPFGPHNLVPIDINEDDNEDSGESFSIHTDEIITNEIDLS